MTYAIDIIEDTFKRTKELFFPIRFKYWLRMGFISLFSGRSSGANGSNSSGFNQGNNPNFGSFSQAISTFNTEALSFLSQYGFIIGIVFAVLYFISLFFTYINSVFTFVFLDGIVKKDIRIIKGFKENHKHGINLFFLRFIVGLFSLLILLLILSPVLIYFFSNNLVNFNLWLLIPMGIFFFLFVVIVGIFYFLVFDFVIPIMYFKKYAFFPAWKYLVKIASNKKMEIFIYWLLKIGLGIASGIISLILFIPVVIIFLIPVAIGVLIYFGLRASSQSAAIGVVVAYGIIVFMLFVYVLSVVSVPITAFFRMYSLKMLEKLETT